MINILVDEDQLLEYFVDRVKFWTDNSDTIELYRKMYENNINSTCYEDSIVDIQQIVDNDYINYCSILSAGEDRFDEVEKYYKENGCGDCSCDIDGISYIEAEHNGSYLIRW